jgi:hypothetical protein
VALPFIPSDAGLLALQAAVVAAPRPISRVAWLERFRGRGWALVPIGSIVVVVFAIRYVSDTATGLTDLALVAVPILAALALGWAMRGARPVAALGAIPLFIVAWTAESTLAGEAAGSVLSALSCVTLGVLLSAVTPSRWLKVGIVLMAAADSWLVVSDLLQSPNAVLLAAQPPAGLPQLQSEIFGTVSMGYGDLFVAALLGAVLASQWRQQWQAAVLTLVIAAVFDLLFLVISELPATVPVALALLVTEGWQWAAVRRSRRQCAPSPPVEAGGRDSSASEVMASMPRAASSSTSVASSADRA